MSVASFDMAFTPSAKDLYLYPNADSAATALTRVGDIGENYKAVDEEKNSPDTSTYVYTVNTSVVSDRYSLPDHTTESGDINYVQVFLRGKSNTYPASSSAIYKISIKAHSSGGGDPVDTHYSDSFNITTDYNTYSDLWTSQPSDSSDWAWSVIDNLEVGVMCSSPLSDGADRTLTLRPNATGDMEKHLLMPGGSGENYEQCDEETSDEAITHVYYSSNADASDSYNIPNHTTETGTINSISIFYRIRTQFSGDREFDVRPLLNVASSGTQYGTYRQGNGSWTTYSDNWTSQPSDSSPWTWDAIDSMQIGFQSDETTGNPATSRRAQITQVYAVVYYSEPVSPEIRTTQCYAKVNYITSTSTYYLSKPISISKGHSRNVGMHNFWDGSREVYDINLAHETITMNGIETGSGGDTDMDDILDILDYDNKVEIKNLHDLYDGGWYIQDFNFIRMSSTPTMFNWTMTLERAP